MDFYHQDLRRLDWPKNRTYDSHKAMVMLPVGPMMVPMPEDMALWRQSCLFFAGDGDVDDCY